MRFAICNELFEGRDFAETCRFVKAAGYDGLEIAPFTLAPRAGDVTSEQRAALRRAAEETGIEIVGLHWLLAKTTGLHLTSPDAAVRDALSHYLVELAALCRDLGGRVMVFGSPQQRSLQPGVEAAQAFAWATDVFRHVMPAVADHGVTICFEPLAPVETDFVTTCDEGVRLVEAVGHTHFVLHLDVKAMSSEPTPVTDLIARYGSKAGHFHANDANLRGPGFGDTDFVPIFKALQASGYDGWVSVEVFDNAPDPDTIATRSLDYMTSCLAPT